MDKCSLPKVLQVFNTFFMKVQLKVSKASDVVSKRGCPKITQGQCGIQYRSS